MLIKNTIKQPKRYKVSFIRPRQEMEDVYLCILQKRYNDAINEALILLEGNYNHTDAFCAMGVSYMYLKNYNKAIYAFDRAIRLSMQYHHFFHYQGSYQYLLRAEMYFRQGEYEFAIEDYDRAAFLDHVNAFAYYGKGRALHNLGDKSQSIKSFDQAGKLFENIDIEYEKQRRDLLIFNKYNSWVELDFDYELAIYLTEKKDEEIKDIVDSNYQKAISEYREGRFRNAINLCSRVLQQKASYLDAYHLRGNAHHHLGEYKQAAENLKLAVSHNAKSYKKNYDYACHLLRFDVEAALEYFKNTIRLNPGHSNAYLGIARCFIYKQQNNKAIEALNHAIALSDVAHDDYHWQASYQHVNRGFAFTKIKNYDLAITDFSKALDLQKDNLVAMQARAESNLMRGNFVQAMADIKRGLEIAPEHVDLNKLFEKVSKKMNKVA